LPDRVAALYLDMVGAWQLPPLVVISTAPILSDDGGIRGADGYDQDTGIYCFSVPQLSVPEQPTQKQAQAALLKLRQTFQTFPFSDAERRRDKPWALMLSITPSPWVTMRVHSSMVC